MSISDGALREGLLYDLFGRFHQKDARERTVLALEKRMGVDRDQAERVATTAAMLHKQIAAQVDLESEFAGLILKWAARLHEIGLAVAHSHHDRHAAYLLKHADLAGFPKNEQALLAVLVGAQRREIQVPFEDIADSWQKKALWLTVVLRISILLHRAHSESMLPDITVWVEKNRIGLDFPKGWLKEQPLTLADLSREKEYLNKVGLTLSLNADS
jgi:exopolyphosphatase/guanosine-5'-triphosphate,3'-diphosphate pyrophosphatase